MKVYVQVAFLQNTHRSKVRGQHIIDNPIKLKVRGTLNISPSIPYLDNVFFQVKVQRYSVNAMMA